MLDPNDIVNDEGSVTSIDQQAVNQDTVEETTDTETPAVETTESNNDVAKEQSIAQGDVDERGIPCRNRAMEAERKLNEFPTSIPKIIEETLAKSQQQQQQQQQPKYTKENIPQLRQYAIDNPQYAGWVEQQITDIQLSEQARVVKSEIENFKQEQINSQIRQQSEQYIVNHPVFKDCFVADSYGNKSWNMANPLTQEMANVLNTVDPSTGKMVKDRPDGLRIAAEIAYGRTALTSLNQSKTAMQTLKKDLKKAQKTTLISGGGKPSLPQNQSTVKKALEQYNKTYNKSDISAAVKGYLRASGIIKEE